MRSLLFQSREGLPAPVAAVADSAGWWRRRWHIDPRLFLPRTMSGLVAAGCLLAAAPLLLALLLAASRLDRFSHHSELLVREGVAVVRLGSQLRDNVNDLERSLRQYGALGDPALVGVIRSRLGETEKTLRELGDLDLDPLADPVYAAQRELVQVAKQWTESPQPEAMEPLARRVHTIGGEVNAILLSGSQATDAEVGRLQAASVAARRTMLVSSITLIPLTALLALAISAAVTRPLRKLGTGIAELGGSRYERPVSIRFPVEMRRLGDQLDWLRRRLAQLEADKARFLRNVSHELKTPLASLQEGASLLHDEALGPLSPRQREVISILNESIGELDSLIHNLLTYADWRRERQHPPMTWFEAGALAQEVLARHRLPLERRRISTELRLHSERLFGHRPQLRAALENLLSNAIKHAPPDSSIELALGVQDGCCRLSVRDRGRGVAEQEKQMIFEPFVRGTEAEEAGMRGTGVGLAIVHETVRSHNGTVEVEDAQPGACFRMAWPCPADSG
ncbi:MAG TPA: HAMP domain-containing sensor histidine kinase [Nevskia sp.]|nr:HAMP domain-containing sensor histidine kinase [Nevskia sp.]